MNKKVNTLLFILGATFFNVIIAVISFILLLILYASFIVPRLSGGAQSWAFSLIFLSSIAISILVYRIALKFLLARINVEKYFDPLFVRRNIKKPPSRPE
ncbi:MAG: leader peptide processing enzyme [Treponema sp.]|nr:leader peptide processing enzyme [Treponema sp.]